MTLIFGNLTDVFIVFTTVKMMAANGNATAEALVPQATADFRSTASKDALYLVIIGKLFDPNTRSRY